MSLLDKESLSKMGDEFFSRIEETPATSSDSEVTETVEETQETAPVEETTSTEGAQEGSSSTETETQDESGHSIPYGRFKSVVETRNTLRSENDTLKAQLEAMKTQYAKLQQPVAGSASPDVPEVKSSWLDEYINDDYSTEPYGQVDDQRYQQLEQRIHHFEVQKAQTELQKELVTAIEKYPSVKEEILLHAVVQDPNVNVMDVAERYNTFIASIEEDAIARFSKGQKTKKTAPPRVKGVSSDDRMPGSVGNGQQKPKTMKDAKRAALSFLKDFEF